MGVECPGDFGANLVQHFIGRYSQYSRYQTALSKLEEIINTWNSRYRPFGRYLFFCARGIAFKPSVPGTHQGEDLDGRGSARKRAQFSPQAETKQADFALTKGRSSRTPVLQEISSTLVEYEKCSTSVGHFLLSLGEQ